MPPIYGKVFDHPHWRQLWKTAFTALSDAEQLVVVGCSIVDTDYHLQAFLRRLVKERKKHSHKFNKVILVDRVAVRRKWHRVLKGAFTRKMEFTTFEEFLTRGVNV